MLRLQTRADTTTWLKTIKDKYFQDLGILGWIVSNVYNTRGCFVSKQWPVKTICSRKVKKYTVSKPWITKGIYIRELI